MGSPQGIARSSIGSRELRRVTRARSLELSQSSAFEASIITMTTSDSEIVVSDDGTMTKVTFVESDDEDEEQ